jgi:hypothetical protein
MTSGSKVSPSERAAKPDEGSTLIEALHDSGLRGSPNSVRG